MESTLRSRSALRDRRLEAGLTQSELADRAGVSRQLIAAVEAGQNSPGVEAALRLAHSLGTTVEVLFTPARPPVVPALGRPLRDGRPLKVGRVGGELVAAELPDHGTAGAAWARPDGMLESGELRLFPGVTPAGLVIAGCDPALGLAESMLQGLGTRSVLALPAATGTALRALEAGSVHAAVVHGPPRQLPAPPVSVLRWHLARWQVGIAQVSRLRSRTLAELLDSGVPIIQRDPAASSQQALQRAAANLGAEPAGEGPLANGHIDAARAAATLGCAAVTIESAARAFDLGFFPLEEHTVEVWVAERWVDHPGLDAFGELLRSPAFTERVGRLGGYELAGCGNRV
jgi:transcriptional regulator with XRE-family HTH domain